MDRIRPYLIVVAIVAVVAAGVYLTVGRERQRTATMEMPGGKKAEVTPVEEMRVRTAEDAPVLTASGYRLALSGLVKKQFGMTLEEVKALPSVTRLVTLPCVEGWSETALWKGAPLSAVLQRAGTKEGADTVVFSSPGGYTTSLALEDIRRTDPLLAYEVNGVPLPHEQGFPVRLVVPKRLGYKWIKWVTGIELIRGEYEGYWESAGYDNKADASDR